MLCYKLLTFFSLFYAMIVSFKQLHFQLNFLRRISLKKFQISDHIFSLRIIIEKILLPLGIVSLNRFDDFLSKASFIWVWKLWSRDFLIFDLNGILKKDLKLSIIYRLYLFLFWNAEARRNIEGFVVLLDFFLRIVKAMRVHIVFYIDPIAIVVPKLLHFYRCRLCKSIS